MIAMFNKELLRKDRSNATRLTDINLSRYFYRGCSVVESFDRRDGIQRHMVSFRYSDYTCRLDEDDIAGILQELGFRKEVPLKSWVQKNIVTEGSTVYFTQEIPFFVIYPEIWR